MFIEPLGEWVRLDGVKALLHDFYGCTVGPKLLEKLDELPREGSE